jgi:signal transduction histidine kinase
VRRYAIGFAIVTAIGLFFSTQDISRGAYFGDPTPAWRYVVIWVLGTWIVGLTLPAVIALANRFPIERPRRLASLCIHVVACLVFTAVVWLVSATVYTWLGLMGPVPLATAAGILAVLSLHNNVVSYWLIIGGVHGYRYYKRYEERRHHAIKLESELARAQLAALKNQLQPHFLFNTLNAIMVLVRQQKGALAEDTIARLSDLLRCVLDDVTAQEVPLRRELEYIRLYLGIEQLRFADRLNVEIDAAPDTLDATVPHMGLQPLVENAVRHGIGGSASAGRISIHANKVAESLELTVSDDGPGLGATTTPGHGIGLANVRARLGQLYGDRATLVLANGAASGATVTMVVPYRVAEPESVHARADR